MEKWKNLGRQGGGAGRADATTNHVGTTGGIHARLLEDGERTTDAAGGRRRSKAPEGKGERGTRANDEKGKKRPLSNQREARRKATKRKRRAKGTDQREEGKQGAGGGKGPSLANEKGDKKGTKRKCPGVGGGKARTGGTKIVLSELRSSRHSFLVPQGTPA